MDIEEKKFKESISTIYLSIHLPFPRHFVGILEIIIKSTKSAVYDQSKNSRINNKELLSAFAGAQGLLNARPFTHQSANACNVSPVTPNHILFDRLGGLFAPEAEELIYYCVKRHLQLLVQCFWKHWMSELVPILNRRNKWLPVRRNVKVSKVVLVISAKVPRGQWSLEVSLNWLKEMISLYES